MKLKELLEVKLYNSIELKELIKKRIPEADNFTIREIDSLRRVSLSYKNHPFQIIQVPYQENYFLVRSEERGEKINKDEIEKLRKEIELKIHSISREEAVEKTKEIRKAATKLPKKKFKL